MEVNLRAASETSDIKRNTRLANKTRPCRQVNPALAGSDSTHQLGR
jgi:hypothetical protein